MIEKKVLEAIKDYNMLTKERKITVALSGGADSVCLLHVLLKLKDRLNIELSAAHLNHLIRGEEAVCDENFVRALCKRLSVPVFIERINIPEYASKNGLSTELAARQIRYDFLNRVSTGLIATAHNSGDNLETVLLNLTRGTALKGLCGIPAVRDNIIRPLIYCSRGEIEEYCSKNRLDYVTDSTNLSDDYTRNKIRHNIIPLIKELNPSVETAVLRMGRSLSEDSEYIERLADRELSSRLRSNKALSLNGFANLHISVASRLLKMYCRLLGVDEISSSHISQLYNICMSGGEAQLPKCIFVSESGCLHLKPSTDKVKTFSVDITPVSAKKLNENQKINNLLLKNYIDCDKIIGKLIIRTRQSGDTVRLKNKNGTKQLTKLYNEYRIPLELRESLPVMADDKGIVWIYKIGVAERCAVDVNSVSLLKVSVFEDLGDE